MSETIESGTLVVIPATQLPAIMAADGASDLLAALYSDCKSVPRVHMCRISLSVHNLFYL